MSPAAKKEYVKTIVERYRNASKKKKSLILDEFCSICGYHRKYAIERLNTFNAAIPRKRPGKPSPYHHPDVLDPLIKIWMAAINYDLFHLQYQKHQPVQFTRSGSYKKMITLTLNRKTGPMSANGSVIIVSIIPVTSLCSVTFTPSNGVYSSTSLCRPSKSSKRIALDPESSKNMTPQKLLIKESWNPLLLMIKPNKTSKNNINPSTPLLSELSSTKSFKSSQTYGKVLL